MKPIQITIHVTEQARIEAEALVLSCSGTLHAASKHVKHCISALDAASQKLAAVPPRPVGASLEELLPHGARYATALEAVRDAAAALDAAEADELAAEIRWERAVEELNQLDS